MILRQKYSGSVFLKKKKEPNSFFQVHMRKGQSVKCKREHYGEAVLGHLSEPAHSVFPSPA